jgi:hypothetical protein
VAAALLSISATLPAGYPFGNPDAATHGVTAVLTPAGSPSITAPGTARYTEGMATGTVQAAVWTAHVGQPFDPEGDLLNPVGIAAYFAQDGFTGSGCGEGVQLLPG